jgi:hypothetical protein
MGDLEMTALCPVRPPPAGTATREARGTKRAATRGSRGSRRLAGEFSGPETMQTEDAE